MRISPVKSQNKEKVYFMRNYWLDSTIATSLSHLVHILPLKNSNISFAKNDLKIFFKSSPNYPKSQNKISIILRNTNSCKLTKTRIFF